MNKIFSNSTNEIIKCVFSKNITPYKRDFGRNRYHIARKFWALVLHFILSNKQNTSHLYIGLHSVIKHNAVLFYDALRFEYECYQVLNGKDRDWINSYRDTKEFQQVVHNSAELYQSLIKTLFNLIGELKDSFSPDTINYLSISIKERPQPYLLSPDQVLQVLSSELQVELTDNEILWPFRNLTPTELNKLDQIMDSILFHTVFERIAQQLIDFDKSYAVTFDPFKVIDDEMDAIQSFNTTYQNDYGFDLAQTKYFIETVYRKKNGDRLNSENLGRYLRRSSSGQN